MRLLPRKIQANLCEKKIEVTNSVCQPSSISQIKTGPCAPAVNVHFALEPPSQKAEEKHCAPPISLLAKKQQNRSFEERAREKSNAEITQGSPLATSLLFHKVYLQKRLEKMPSYVSTKKLLKEITARGYRGDAKVLQRFLFTIRIKAPQEASLKFHKDYLIKRLKESTLHRGLTKQLFQEIKAKGYRGALNTVQGFLSTTYEKKKMRKTSLDFHKDYLIKRVKESTPQRGLTKQLFQEITDRGYRGAMRTLQLFLATMTRTKAPEEASLKFHKDYLIKRLQESNPEHGLTKQLFQEIKAKGYQGSLSTIQGFLSIIRQKKKVRKTSLEFYKEYLKKRIEETAPNYVSAKQLFQEITDKGYRGSPDTMRGFLSMIRQQKKIKKTSLGFHKEYLKKRVEEAAPNRVLAKQLFQEITDRGYRGSIRTLQLFLAAIRANKDVAKKQISAPHPVAERPCAKDPLCSPIDVAADLNALFDDVAGKDFLHSPFFSPLYSINPLCNTPT